MMQLLSLVQNIYRFVYCLLCTKNIFIFLLTALWVELFGHRRFLKAFEFLEINVNQCVFKTQKHFTDPENCDTGLVSGTKHENSRIQRTVCTHMLGNFHFKEA